MFLHGIEISAMLSHPVYPTQGTNIVLHPSSKNVKKACLINNTLKCLDLLSWLTFHIIQHHFIYMFNMFMLFSCNNFKTVPNYTQTST